MRVKLALVCELRGPPRCFNEARNPMRVKLPGRKRMIFQTVNHTFPRTILLRDSPIGLGAIDAKYPSVFSRI